jgi:hypothetical protein
MSHYNDAVDRRTVLKGLGATAVVGTIGLAASGGSAAAQMNSSFSAANPGTVASDDGDVSEVFVVPRVSTSWENFDEVPLKLRYVLEAGIDGQGFKPVYRETPWLFTNGDSEETAYESATHGTTGRYPDGERAPLASKNSNFYRNQGRVLRDLTSGVNADNG